MNDTDLIRFKAQLDLWKADGEIDKIVQRVADYKNDCDVDNGFINSYRQRLIDFQAYAAEEEAKIQAQIDEMISNHKNISEIYAYGKSLLPIAPKKEKPVEDEPVALEPLVSGDTVELTTVAAKKGWRKVKVTRVVEEEVPDDSTEAPIVESETTTTEDVLTLDDTPRMPQPPKEDDPDASQE